MCRRSILAVLLRRLRRRAVIFRIRNGHRTAVERYPRLLWDGQAACDGLRVESDDFRGVEVEVDERVDGVVEVGCPELRDRVQGADAYSTLILGEKVSANAVDICTKITLSGIAASSRVSNNASASEYWPASTSSSN
jgi:hypothetical protein